MYHYRNKKTGSVIKTHNKVTGENWDLVEDDDSQMTDGEDFEEDAFEEDAFEEDAFEDEIPEDTTGEEEPEQTEVAEEAPIEKPKASRRGKK